MPSASTSPRRRDYTTTDYKHIAQHYPHEKAATVAAQMGRTIGSFYEFIARHPELRKHGRI
jgi:plasmid stabilization system protein ParE